MEESENKDYKLGLYFLVCSTSAVSCRGKINVEKRSQYHLGHRQRDNVEAGSTGKTACQTALTASWKESTF